MDFSIEPTPKFDLEGVFPPGIVGERPHCLFL